ncbi:MAG: hypothetical protein WCP28_07440 [Actinomycetes bacterium]
MADPKSSGPTRNDPNLVTAEVWLTAPACADLEALDPSVVILALRKMLLLERNPLAGEALVGSLVGWRKLVVGNRDWRIVWRAITDERGAVTVEIAEVWAVGARSDSDVYSEMRRRLEQLGDHPDNQPLAQIIEAVGAQMRVQAHPPRQPPSRPEPWLVERLVHTAGLSASEVEGMTTEQAVDAWAQYMVSRRQD